MILYGAPNPAPNPRRVRIFLAEAGIDLPETPLNMMKREHKAEDFRAKNSLGQVPTLELDDGTIITETVAICRYLDETSPGPSLFGATPLERAQIDMWIRRVEFRLMAPVGGFWGHAHPYTAKIVTQFKDYGESNRTLYAAAQQWIDGELAGRSFVAGETYSMADICLLSTVDFAGWIGLPLEPAHQNLAAWHARVTARPSSTA